MQNNIHGDEVTPVLGVNPYNLDEVNSEKFTNGFEYAKQLGHTQLNTLTDEQVLKWKTSPTAWRDGFVDGLNKLGLGRMSEMLKTAIVGELIADPLITSHLTNQLAEENDLSKRQTERIRTTPSQTAARLGISLIPAVGGGLAGSALGGLAMHALGNYVTDGNASPLWASAGALGGFTGGSLAVGLPIQYYKAKQQIQHNYDTKVAELLGGVN